jgi:hypothetical protein
MARDKNIMTINQIMDLAIRTVQQMTPAEKAKVRQLLDAALPKK